MAKKAKLVVKITIEDSRRESPQVFEGNGSYAVIASVNNGDKKSVISRAAIGENPKECEGMLLSALKFIKNLIGNKPYLMGLLFDYLDGNVGDEIFEARSEEVSKCVIADIEGVEISEKSAVDDQSEEPKAETDEAETEGGSDDGEDH